MSNGILQKTACFTGHRDIPAEKLEQVKRELCREIEEAVADGYECFISGFADGVDQIAAAIVLEVKEKHPHLHLEAVVPYPNRLKQLYKNESAAALLRCCSGIGVSSDAYSRDCYMIRNRQMLSMSSRVIAVYDGREKGGTVQTLRFAHVQEKEIREIRV